MEINFLTSPVYSGTYHGFHGVDWEFEALENAIDDPDNNYIFAGYDPDDEKGLFEAYHGVTPKEMKVAKAKATVELINDFITHFKLSSSKVEFEKLDSPQFYNYRTDMIQVWEPVDWDLKAVEKFASINPKAWAVAVDTWREKSHEDRIDKRYRSHGTNIVAQLWDEDPLTNGDFGEFDLDLLLEYITEANSWDEYDWYEASQCGFINLGDLGERK